MAFVIWYRVELSGAGGGPAVKASNDVAGADWLCDADIRLTMLDGVGGGTFAIELRNLPAAAGKQLAARHEHAPEGDPLVATAFLGYFDDVPLVRRPPAVMAGAVTDVSTNVSDTGELKTTLSGQELATWRLLRRQNISRHYEQEVQLSAVLSDALTDTHVESEGQLTGSHAAFTFRAVDGLAAIDQIARLAATPVVLRDGKVLLGARATAAVGPAVDDDANAVSLDTALSTRNARRSRADGRNGQARPEAATVYDATVLGDHALRAGQRVTVKVTGESPRPLRIQRVEHRFSTADTDGGYTCALRLVDTAATSPPAYVGAHGVVRRIRDLGDTARDAHPYVDVGEVTEYETGADGKHLVTLNYGQKPGPDVVEPSVETPIETEQKLHHKPIAAPFAWDKCGLMVPAYPGQRALLAHNGGDPNDAVVAGYLWSEDPAYARPKNEAGDWWLCLPTELQGGTPAGKGANDLTDAAGLRVLQAKGLEIDVGADLLPGVGDRPQVPDADTFTIKHKSGTEVTIDSGGKVVVKASNQDVELTNGSVTLKLSGASVDVS